MAFALMSALLVNIDHVFFEGMPESRLSNPDVCLKSPHG